VVGRPDELKGQALVAFVTLKTGQSHPELREELRQHVAKEIGPVAKPDDIRFAEALPKTRSGKIMRRLLKQIAAGTEIKGDTTTLEDFPSSRARPKTDAVKSLAPAFRELTRIAVRQILRLRLILERRKLARLETALGLLGWQQADYDETTQEQVNRLNNCEREQARLTNEGAALALEIQRIEEQRGVAERELAEAQAVALEKEFPTARTVQDLEEQIATQRRERKAIEARLPVVDRELTEAERQYRGLVLPSVPPPEVQAELQRLRKLILALPRERAEWQTKLAEADRQIVAMETLLASLQEAQANFERRAGEWAAEIAARQRAKRKLEKDSEALEKAKTDPYREIGRTLADHRVAPRNQPDALAAVLTQRQVIATREAALAASLAESARAAG
jgi:chromosome segregation ATPase